MNASELFQRGFRILKKVLDGKQSAEYHSAMNTKPEWSERFWSKVNIKGNDVCWLWTAHIDARGYGRFKLKDGTQATASRLSWELANGQIPSGLFVCHRCDNPACVNPNHLFLGTPAENMADKTAKGRQSRPQGEKHPMRKLTDEMVKQIRHLRATTNLKQIEIAKQFGVSNTVISRIENNVLWSHL